MKLPNSLTASDDTTALDRLHCYFGRGSHSHHGQFTGAYFDTWDPAGTRERDADRFTSDDLVAVTFLSVTVPPRAAHELLVVRADQLSEMLVELGGDRELADESRAWDSGWVGWSIWEALGSIRGLGPTTVSKLYARKRPRLRPIYDTVVAEVIGQKRLWEPLRAHLQDDPALQPRLLALHAAVGLPAQVSAIRVLDVLTWMQGRYGDACPWPPTDDTVVALEVVNP